MTTIHDIIAAQVRKAKAENRLSWGKGDIEVEAGQPDPLMEMYLKLPHLQRAVGAWLARMGAVKPYIPNLPLDRSVVGQAAHVTCIGWDNPKAVNRWVFETNVFWLNYGRFIELRNDDTTTQPQGE